MILDRKPIDLTEVKEILVELPESEKKSQMEVYLKKFSKITPEKAKKIKEEIEKLEILKIKREHLVKIIDIIPEDMTDLNKIFSDVSLNEDETNRILEVIKKNK